MVPLQDGDGPRRPAAAGRGLPSPVLAGAASLLAFSLGALVPLLPYLLGFAHLAATLIITGVALITGGMVVGRLTGRPILRSGLRQQGRP